MIFFSVNHPNSYTSNRPKHLRNHVCASEVRETPEQTKSRSGLVVAVMQVAETLRFNNNHYIYTMTGFIVLNYHYVR